MCLCRSPLGGVSPSWCTNWSFSMWRWTWDHLPTMCLDEHV
jgi:hypothetical protein